MGRLPLAVRRWSPRKTETCTQKSVGGSVGGGEAVVVVVVVEVEPAILLKEDRLAEDQPLEAGGNKEDHDAEYDGNDENDGPE